MKIYMIGAGAMGGVYGGLLRRAGYDVTLIDIRKDHIQKIRNDGLTVEGVRGTHVIRLPSQLGETGLPPADLAIVFTDANSTAEAARTARRLLKPDGVALTLQNGIGNVEALVAELGRDKVIAGVSMNSAANPGLARSAYTHGGMTSIGELDGRDTERIRKVAEMFNKAEIPTEIVADPMSQIWGKFAHNCAVNALAAVSGLRTGELFRVPEMNALQERVIDEILAVVKAKGWNLPENDPRKKIREHSRMRYNKPSMLQHMEKGQRTEIDALNGALVREARALGIPVPYNETIVAFVKGLEKSRRQALQGTSIDYTELERKAAEE
ncbi:MAG TPA: ketopantoate reductase family protein [Burkholderiales bacterium]